MVNSIQALDSRQHRVHDFCCGEPELDLWLQTMASQHRKRNISSTFVCIDPAQPETIIGYYALTVSEISRGVLPDLLKKMPLVIPVVKLGRLAIDQRFQGQGHGRVLLADALYRAASQVAGVGLVVDALHPEAAAFYQGLGFVRFAADALKLFYPLVKLR
jgi:GNAT superfamily N-acetyltransferase